MKKPGGIPMKKRLIALLLVLAVLVPCVASAESWYRLTSKKRLFNLPDYDSRVMDTYRTDWALTVTRAVDKTWVEVTFSNGVSGYLERKYIVIQNSSSAWISANTAHLKHGPGSSFANEGTLSCGDYVTVLTRGNNWSYVTSAAGNGYVSNGALSSSKVTPGSAAPAYKNVNYTAWIFSKGDPVGLRSAPSGDSHVVMETFYPGTQVTVLKEGSEFHYVKIGSSEGYMRAKYLTRTKPAQAYQLEAKKAADAAASGGTKPASSEETSSGFPFMASARENGGEKPKAYMGPGAGWSSETLAVGTSVKVVGPCSDIYWYEVEINGLKRYMPSKFIIR